jgi:hypothetical protein
MKQLIGFSQAKREIAHKFHVDVYSTNKELQDHLDRLAWADYTGGITISVAALPVGGAAKVVYSSSNVVRLLNEAIALTPPAELKRQNREKLEKMGMDPNLIDLFINNVQLSPRQQTYIVAALEAMTEAVNREVALMIALPVKDPEEAMAITTLIIMYAGYNNNVTKLKQLYPVKRILGARDAEGDLVLLLPVDHLTWNAKLDGVLASVTEESARLGNGKRHTIEATRLERANSRRRDHGHDQGGYSRPIANTKYHQMCRHAHAALAGSVARSAAGHLLRNL